MRTLDPLAIPLTGRQLIEASAGTGKTYTLATLYLRHVLAGRSVRDVLVVTFTVAATEELRERIRARLAEALAALSDPAKAGDPLIAALIAEVADPEAARRWLSNELACIDEAAIFTIHGFCQRMLSEHAFESGALFDTEFVTSGRDILLTVAEDWWRRTLYPAGSGVAAMATAMWGDPAGLVDAIGRFVTVPDLWIHPRPAAADCDEAAFQTAWSRFCAAWCPAAERLCEALRTSQALGRAKETYRLDRLEALLAAVEVFVAQAPADYELPTDFHLLGQSTLDAAVSAAKRKKGLEAPCHDAFGLAETLLGICRQRRDLLVIEAIEGLRDALPMHKQAIGKLAFDDLLSGLAGSLSGDGGEPFARRIAARFPVAMIDEFQDTDAQQWRIFERIYPPGADGTLTLIGDPKQAIYSFRGADIYTYIEAKRATAVDERYTLGINWRSAGALVEAVNAVFASAADPFLHPGEIDFVPVRAAGKADAAPLVREDEDAALTVWWQGREPGEALINKAEGRERAAQCTARGIAALLGAGNGRIGERPIQPGDIAVLVRTHAEGVRVQDALRSRRIASVLVSRESVFASEEAQWLDAVLTAVVEPGDEAGARGALSTPMMGYDASALDRLNRDERRLDRLVEDLQTLHQLWRDRGFMPMFQRWIAHFDVGARLARLGDGERRLTNLMQLAELLQGMSRQAPGMDALLRTYRGRMASPDPDDDSEQLRLESDEARVRIVTIHKSKGLEYEIVVLPFLWACRDVDAREPLLVHRPGGGRLLDLGVDAENLARARRERLAEDLRLTYVALTRARHRCYLVWGGYKDAHDTALAWLLGGGQPPLDYKQRSDDELRRQWQPAIEAAAGALALRPVPLDDVDYRPRDAAPASLIVRKPQGRIYPGWRLGSYSGLLDESISGEIRPEHGSAAEDSGGIPVLERLDPAAAFPRGAAAGTCLHAIFETLDFTQADGPALVGAALPALRAAGIADTWADAAAMLVRRTLDTCLTDDGLRLRDVPPVDRLNELEFHLRVDRLEAAKLQKAMSENGLWMDGGPRLAFSPLSGQIRGFIDLVVRWKGRYYVVDYKSNWLGSQPSDYAPAALRQAVADHRYDLQYLLYTRAMDRFLRQRVCGYDYERDFGGVLYLFLRGLRPEHGARFGVHALKPAIAGILDG